MTRDTFAVRSCALRSNFDVLHAYLTSSNYDFSYDRSKNLRPRRNIRTAMSHEINMYGVLQKEQMGFDKAVEDCKYRMSRYGVVPNMLLVPPQMLLYMALAPEQKLTYKEGGPSAEARFEGGVAALQSTSFRGCSVFTSEPFEVSDDADSVQMLTRNSQVGEFYIMQPPQTDPAPTGTEEEKQAKATNSCDILIFDEESDRHVRVTWQDAMNACCIGDGGDDTVDKGTEMSVKTKKMTNKTLGQWKEAARAINDYNQGKKLYNEIDPEIRIVIARPFIEHLMHSAVLTVAGRDTGATLFGPADMQLAANTQVKTIEGCDSMRQHASINFIAILCSRRLHRFDFQISAQAKDAPKQNATAHTPPHTHIHTHTHTYTHIQHRHYTGHFKAVITKPQNVFVMRDIACAGYVAGCNCDFFAKETTPGDFSLATASQNIMSRLSFSNDVGERYGSMLAFPCTEGQIVAGHMDTVMSVTTRLLPWEVTGGGGGDHNSFPGGENVFKQYSAKLNLRQIHFGEDIRATENQEFISQGSTNNALCFLGPHRHFDPFTRNFMSLVPGQGHFGADAIPGVMKRHGLSTPARPLHFET